MTPSKNIKPKTPSKWRKNGEGKHYPFMKLRQQINAKQLTLNKSK